MEAKEELCAVIDTVIALKEKFNSDYIVNILIGRPTDEVRSHGHDNLDEFGCLSNADEKMLATIIRQAVIAGYLEKDMDNLDTVKVTSKGKKYLKKPESFKVVEDNDFSDMEMEPQIKGGAACVTDPALYSMLTIFVRKWRRS